MGATEVQAHDEARRRLLEEGVRSYLDAVTALIEYQREVQKKCRAVMEARLGDYASALKIPLKSSDIRDWASPKFEKWEGTWWCLGGTIFRRNITPKIRWWDTSCCLQYELGENGLFCWIGVGFPTTKMTAFLHRQFHRLNRKVLQQGREVWIEHSLKKEEGAAFEKSLEALFQQWIELWNKVGGIKQAFKGGGDP